MTPQLHMVVDWAARPRTPYERLKSALFFYVVLTHTLAAYRHLRARGVAHTIREFLVWIHRQTLLLLIRLPPMRKKVSAELAAARLSISASLVPSGPHVSRHLALPPTGMSPEWIEAEMARMDAEMAPVPDSNSGSHPNTNADTNANTNTNADDAEPTPTTTALSTSTSAADAHWAHGKLSGAVYHGGPALTAVLVRAFARYAVANPLHPEVFPAVRKMEAEVVQMCLRMYHAPGLPNDSPDSGLALDSPNDAGTTEGKATGAGTMTSGGTESIIMAVKTYRDWARATKGITRPEMVVPASAHAAFDKGGAYLGVKVHTVPVDPVTRKVDVGRVRRAINRNTIMLVASAINFPDGNQDDVPALGALAAAHGVGLHVDCCLGSFVVPFLEEANLAAGETRPDGRVAYKLEPFDFRVRGVTSVSCDTHKGSSVIMYRSAELRRYQYYVTPDWSGGVYASPSLSGSRPGALIAGTWAAMQYMGSAGYLASCRAIVSATRRIANAIEDEIPELYVLGSPPASVVAFAAREGGVDIMEVGDAMGRRGWHLNAISGPAAVHIACTLLTVPVVDTFIADLKASVEEAKTKPSGQGTMVRLYGLGKSSAVGPTMVRELAASFLDTLYQA
ncbi:PLP-dependent transferase [Leucogyrophana mollusca]|uniref:PLP-dependent transferase n=1 Tax=Leucogyrophana mollusca TaxID=85980 RepID=A0ACB8BJZ8_9AGAM|nr:PLP-dependent transferase [Leucogyrophana mollusca]